jgi:hypothetical protein
MKYLKIKIFVLFVLVVSFSGFAASWIPVASDNNGDEFFIDADSVKTDNSLVTFKGLRNYKIPEKSYGSLSSIGKFTADCKGGGIRLHEYVFFTEKMGMGELINSFPITEKEWFYPRYGTVGGQQLSAVCGQNAIN